MKELLDIGCGSELELDRIFEKRPDVQVTGIDLSAEMPAALRRTHPDRKLTMIQDDYVLHDLGETRFDCVISFETLHHANAEKKALLFRKINRSLKPGGFCLECDYIAAMQALETLLFFECDRRRSRDGIPEDVSVHFDTPLTLKHELSAMEAAAESAQDSCLHTHKQGGEHLWCSPPCLCAFRLPAASKVK